MSRRWHDRIALVLWMGLAVTIALAFTGYALVR